jgi:hypothetical protein
VAPSDVPVASFDSPDGVTELGPAAASPDPVERPLDGRVTAFLDTTWFAESFETIDESATADERSGHRVEVRSGMEGVVTPEIRAGVSVGITRKTARADFEEFIRADIEASATAIVFENHYIQGAFTVGKRDYDDNDPFISATTREDTFARVRLSYGLPLRLTEAFPEELEGVRLVPSVEYYHQDSNIPNFEFENLTTSLVISKDFSF